MVSVFLPFLFTRIKCVQDSVLQLSCKQRHACIPVFHSGQIFVVKYKQELLRLEFSRLNVAEKDFALQHAV